MIKRILVPLDGSELAEGVLPPVKEMAKALRAEVYFIRVVGVQPRVEATGLDAGALLDPQLMSEELEVEAKAAESYLSALADEWRAEGIDAQRQVVREVVGRGASETIVAFARENGIDLITMSTHGRSGISRLLLGSVAEHVVREAGMPVMVVNANAMRAKGAGT